MVSELVESLVDERAFCRADDLVDKKVVLKGN
jgi:hypothetical protein